MTLQALIVLRLALQRAAAAIVIMAIALFPVVTPAHAANLRQFAGIVVDAKSGEVMYEHAADATRYPASVTKVMTLYILFQELAAGNISLNTKMTVSRHAADAVPTKLGLRRGSQISVENAIKSLVTLSANDMARVIAEHISGSESAFAERMTSTARALGMRNTTYRNASGLPNTAQKTTVRDQAILAIAIYQHFPTYYEYFQTRSFTYNGRTHGNHNRLLGENGVDGIKTGYINASGFNLMTAARANNRHIVVIAFGFDTSGGRDRKVRELVREYLPDARRGDYLRTALIPQPGRQGSIVATAPVPVTPAPYPAFRLAELEAARRGAPEVQVAAADPDTAQSPVVPETVVQAAATAVAPAAAAPEQVASIQAPQPASPPQDMMLAPALQAANTLGNTQPSAPLEPYESEVIGAFTSDSYTLGAPPTALGSTMPSAPLVLPVDPDGRPLDPMTSGSVGLPAQIASAAPAGIEGWIVQIGAAPNEISAQTLLLDATTRVAGLSDFRPYVERFEKDGQTFFRARFVGFGDRDQARTMCERLKQANLSCLAMQS